VLSGGDPVVIRRQFQLEGKFVVMYTGALGISNDIDTILRAAATLRDQPEIHFLIAGNGQEADRLRQHAKELELHNVTFAGWFPKQQMRDVLAAADVCVATLLDIPEFRTTYPNKVFDYMAAGRPILLGIDGVIRQVVEESAGGICFPPGDDQGLSAGVLQLYADRPLAQAMGERACSYVRQHFDRARHARQLEKLLLDICYGARAATPQKQSAH
jgi:glycosyltransferase involved in cell wall biosynthesis